MDIRDRLANFLSRGKYNELQKLDAALTPHPGLGLYEHKPKRRYRGVNLAYFFEREVSHFSDIVHKTVQELFRNGVEWQPRFVKKCNLCDNEMDELGDSCDYCGSTELRDPNAAELLRFKHLDGTDFLDVANRNDQSLLDVLQNYDFHLEVADNGNMFCRKKYVLHDDGSIKDSFPFEFIAIDPRQIEKVCDEKTGSLGGMDKICLRHRDEPRSKEGKCPKCGGRLYDIHYQTTSLSGDREYFIKGEVHSTIKYFNQIISGIPPAMKMKEDLWAYYYLEKLVSKYYEVGRPDGFVSIPIANLESMNKIWADTQQKMKEDPYYIPWLAFDPQGKGGIQFVRLQQDPSADLLAVKKDLRERIGSYYGVSPVFQGDTSVSGGLNNEGLQITITNRAIEFGQKHLNDKVLPWMVRQFGINDWKLVLKPSEEKDEMAELQRQSLAVDIASRMRDMGFKVEYEDGEFNYSGEASEKQEMPTMPGLSPLAPNPPEANPQGTPAKAKSETHEEWIDSLYEKELTKGLVSYLIAALTRADTVTAFAKLAPQETEAVYESIINVMTDENGWSISRIVDKLKPSFPQLNESELERIARTETSRIANKARELQYEEKHPDGRYIWIGPNDHRTTKICDEIKRRQPAEGLSLKDLKALINQVAGEHGIVAGEWLPHINCRHTFRRVM